MTPRREQLLASLLDAGRRYTARELAAEVGVCHKTVYFILLYVYVYAVVPIFLIGDHGSYFLDDRFQLFTAIFKSDGSDLQYGKTFK